MDVGSVEPDVLEPRQAGADAEDHAPAGLLVEVGERRCDDRGMTRVDIDQRGSEPDRRGRLRVRREQADRIWPEWILGLPHAVEASCFCANDGADHRFC